ncbi:MAG: sensor histidine kinase [Bacteroidota bacterium]
MLSDLLTWSILQIDGQTQSAETIDLNALVSENFKLISRHAELKNNQLINDIDKTHYAKANPTVLNLILRNLISNAVKFTDGGRIVVSARTQELNTSIDVTDTGVGMDREEIDKLFKWEERKTSMGTRSEKGSGIGLLISKDFIEKFGGSLKVTSEKNRGTTFSLVLPQC